jgi:hypothetical protein
VSFLDSGSRFYKASRGRIGAELVRLDDVETSEQLLVLDSLERSKSYRDLCKRWQWDIGESPKPSMVAFHDPGCEPPCVSVLVNLVFTNHVLLEYHFGGTGHEPVPGVLTAISSLPVNIRREGFRS